MYEIGTKVLVIPRYPIGSFDNSTSAEKLNRLEATIISIISSNHRNGAYHLDAELTVRGWTGGVWHDELIPLPLSKIEKLIFNLD